MILKASQRGGGQDLAAHLLKAENEHVLVHELRGFASSDLKGAFKEAEAISKGTRCSQYLFSLSLSPPERAAAPIDLFERTIGRIEGELGLEGQPRAIVFHEKEGRRHAHCVWSRIDAETMTAKQMSFFKRKLTDISRDLYLEQGWKMPNGIAFPAGRDPTNYSLAEWQQAKRLGQDPRWIKAVVQDCWGKSDNAQSFKTALEASGFFLAKGDRRALVILGHDGEVHSLPRALGLKTKDVKARLGDGSGLGTVDETRSTIGRRMSPAIRRHMAEKRSAFQERSATLAHARMEMTHLHRDQRSKLDERLSGEWQAEVKARAARLPKGLSAFWQRLTGQYRKKLAENEREAALTRERHGVERQKLIDSQLEQRARLQAEIKAYRKRQAEQLLELRKELGRYLGFAKQFEAARLDLAAPRRSSSLSLRFQR